MIIKLLYQKIFSKKLPLKYICGTRVDGSCWNAEINYLNSNINISELNITAACGFLYLEKDPNKLIAIVNKRGVDLPGGHVEPGEDMFEAFYREMQEEAAVKIINSELIALLKTDYDSNVPSYISIFSANCNLLEFNPTTEIQDRLILTPDEFIKQYFGNKDLISKLLYSKKHKYIRAQCKNV